MPDVEAHWNPPTWADVEDDPVVQALAQHGRKYVAMELMGRSDARNIYMTVQAVAEHEDTDLGPNLEDQVAEFVNRVDNFAPADNVDELAEGRIDMDVLDDVMAAYGGDADD